MTDRKCVLRSFGHVQWQNKAHISTLCYMDYEYFPFDIQVCKIKLGSWTYDGLEVKLGLLKYHRQGKLRNFMCHVFFSQRFLLFNENFHS